MISKFVIGKSYKYISDIPNIYPHSYFYVIGISNTSEESLKLAVYWLNSEKRYVGTGHVDLSKVDRDKWSEVK